MLDWSHTCWSLFLFLSTACCKRFIVLIVNLFWHHMAAVLHHIVLCCSLQARWHLYHTGDCCFLSLSADDAPGLLLSACADRLMVNIAFSSDNSQVHHFYCQFLWWNTRLVSATMLHSLAFVFSAGLIYTLIFFCQLNSQVVFPFSCFCWLTCFACFYCLLSLSAAMLHRLIVCFPCFCWCLYRWIVVSVTATCCLVLFLAFSSAGNQCHFPGVLLLCFFLSPMPWHYFPEDHFSKYLFSILFCNHANVMPLS